MRRFELVYRVGGEEFLVVLPGMEAGEGEGTAERLRLVIAGTVVGRGIRVTASFGVDEASGSAIDFDRLYRGADEALYEAKRGGRNRVAFNREPADAY